MYHLDASIFNIVNWMHQERRKTTLITNHRPKIVSLWVRFRFTSIVSRELSQHDTLRRFVPYTFELWGHDEDGDKLRYYVKVIGTDDFFCSGYTTMPCYSFNYTFLEIGTYTIRTWCEDEHHSRSPYKDYIIDVIPLLSNTTNNSGPVDLNQIVFQMRVLNTTNNSPYVIEIDTYTPNVEESQTTDDQQTTNYGNSQEDQVSSSISADFSYTPSSPKAGQTVIFSAESQNNIVSWYWEFGDGATSNQQNPTHVYTTPGTYTVKLTVTDSNGATASVTKSITVSNNSSYQQSQETSQNVTPSTPTNSNTNA